MASPGIVTESSIHPLLDATIDLILERYRQLLRRGAVLVAPDETRIESVRALYYLEHGIQATVLHVNRVERFSAGWCGGSQPHLKSFVFAT